MYEVGQNPITPEFAECVDRAGRHLQGHLDGRDFVWLKARVTPPFLEHLSFRLGNQIFFVNVVDVQGRHTFPGTPEGLARIARGWQGHACVMPMQHTVGGWRPSRSGWGLLDAETGRPVDPQAFVTEAPVAMTNWEVHDLAVQFVRDSLKEEGRRLLSWTGDPSVSPSIWFVGDSGPEWIVVREAICPAPAAEEPAKLKELAQRLSGLGRKGYFMSVAVAGTADGLSRSDPTALPLLWRGHAACLQLEGISEIHA